MMDTNPAPAPNGLLATLWCMGSWWYTYHVCHVLSLTYVILFSLFTCCNKHAISQQQIIGNLMMSTANGRPCLTTTLSTNSRPSHAWGKSMSPIWFVDVSTSMPTNTSCTITSLYHIIILAFLTWRGKTLLNTTAIFFKIMQYVRSSAIHGITFHEIPFFPPTYFSNRINQFDVNKNVRNNKIQLTTNIN